MRNSGGGNEKFFCSIVDNYDMSKNCPDEYSISLTHPFDKTGIIHIWSRGTCSLKAFTYNIYRSQSQFTRNLRLNKFRFGWKDTERIYFRDEKRE